LWFNDARNRTQLEDLENRKQAAAAAICELYGPKTQLENLAKDFKQQVSISVWFCMF
jgi:hypothetical protein